MTVADAIAQFLADKGISHVFGIIGAGNAALFEAIAKKAATQIVCCHHEAAAAMAATYWGRSRGCCGVAITTTGAGSSNAITGALAANMDSAPLLIISGNEPSRYLRAPRLRIVGVQGLHILSALQGVIKGGWGFGTLTTHAALSICYDEAVSNRPGAVWLDIPRDYFNESA